MATLYFLSLAIALPLFFTGIGLVSIDCQEDPTGTRFAGWAAITVGVALYLLGFAR